ncbi:MAG: PIG-L family deacetylase, partial [Vicinamibacterales bacterium]
VAAAMETISIEGDRGWQIDPAGVTGGPALERHQQVGARVRVTVADDALISTRPYFSRNGLQESRYTLSDPTQFGRPASVPPLRAVARYLIDGVSIEIRQTVVRREARLPYGDVLREVRSVPRIAVAMTPSNAIVPVGSTGALRSSSDGSTTVAVEVSLLHNAESATSGRVSLKLPAAWKSDPASHSFAFARAGERAAYRFTVTPAAIDPKPYTVEAVATAAGKEYKEGYETIDHRDLEVRYLYRPATMEVRGVNVATVAGVKVGYVMGVGDSVPQGLQQLGAQVTLLDERALASADLSVYDTIMTGTRAYAVREDLKTYNSRLLDYARNGGNVVVLYNTQELVPNTFAPFPGELPRSAEEVSEEDSPVTILAPAHQSFNWPNKITAADFDGWVEQRGSKFFTTWDKAYTPMISTFDKGQAPQSGGWLTTDVGKGKWTYFAYALHRQLPYGVAGAYRVTANLLALNKTPK